MEQAVAIFRVEFLDKEFKTIVFHKLEIPSFTIPIKAIESWITKVMREFPNVYYVRLHD